MKNNLCVMLMALLFIWSCDKQSTEPDEIKEWVNYTETNSSLPNNHVLSILIDSKEADIEVFLSKEDEAKLLDVLHKRWSDKQ